MQEGTCCPFISQPKHMLLKFRHQVIIVHSFIVMLWVIEPGEIGDFYCLFSADCRAVIVD